MSRRGVVAVLLVLVAALAPASAQARPAWLRGASILVPGDPANQDCRTGVCRHNENTDLTRWHGDIWKATLDLTRARRSLKP